MSKRPPLQLVPFNVGSPVVLSAGTSERVPRRRLGTPFELDIAPLARLIPDLAPSLAAGDTVRLIGPAPLLDGVRNGQLHFVTGSEGFYGLLADAQGKIAGHVQFERASATSRAVATAAVFHLASAATLQYYLHSIDSRLSDLAEQLRVDRQDAAWATVERACEQVVVLGLPLRTRRLSEAERRRLDTEERAVDLVMRQEMRRVVDAASRVTRLRDAIESAHDTHLVGGTLKATLNNVASTVLPGRLGSQLAGAFRSVDKALPHLEVALAALQTHTAITQLMIVDDIGEPGASERNRLRRDSILESSASMRAVVTDLAAVGSLQPDQLDDLLVGDRLNERKLKKYVDATTIVLAAALPSIDEVARAAAAPITVLYLKQKNGVVTARELDPVA